MTNSRNIREAYSHGMRSYLSLEQRGVAVAALVAFVGVAFIGPALARLSTPRTRAERLRDEAAYQAETFRRRARKTRTKMRKQARRLGGGTLRR